MTVLNFVLWDADPDIFHLGGITVRWYGLFFALGFIISQQIMFYIFKKEGKPEKDVETLTIYMLIATVIGARLGHVLFYEPAKYLQDPIEIIKIWEGGLASHGGAFGILIALWLYSRKKKDQSYLWILDRIVIVVALTGCLIRLGNFMNSEIIGKPTGEQWGVVFAKTAKTKIENASQAIEKVEIKKASKSDTSTNLAPVQFVLQLKPGNYNERAVAEFLETDIKSMLAFDPAVREDFVESDKLALNYELIKSKNTYIANVQTLGIPRHPAQLYESFSSLLLFAFLFFLWYKYKKNLLTGLLFGIFLVILFGLRFFYEFLKEAQVDFEKSMTLNMGQWLSIPLVLGGIILLLYILVFKKKSKA